MKNSNDSLKEKAIKANELENVSGGSQAATSVKYVIDENVCENYRYYNNKIRCLSCSMLCKEEAIKHYYVVVDDVSYSQWRKIDPNLCNG